MRLDSILLCLPIFAAALSQSAHAQTTATWNGSIGAWEDGALWSTNPLVPNDGTPAGALYNAVIPDGEVTRTSAVSLQRLTLSGGQLIHASGSPLTAAAGFDWSGGTLRAGTNGDGVQTGAAASSTWSGSIAFDKALVRNGGALTLNDGIQAAVVTEEFETTAGLRNLPGGTVTLQNSGSWLGRWFGEGPEPDGLNNEGQLLKNGSGLFTVGLHPDGFNATPFRNSGTVSVNAGTLLVDALVPSSTGTWNVAAGGTLIFDRSTTLAAGSVLSGAGNVEFGGGASLASAFSLTGAVTLRSTANFNSPGPTAVNQLVIAADGSLAGASAVTVANSLTWLGTISANHGDAAAALGAGATGIGRGDGTFRLEARTFNNAGSFTWPGGTSVDAAKFDIYAGGVFSTQAGGSFTAAGNGTGIVTPVGTLTGSFSNAGTFEKTGTGTRTRLEWIFSNTGVVEAQSGRLEVARLSTPGGTFVSENGAQLYLEVRSVALTLVTDHSATYAVKPGGTLEFGPGVITAAAAFPDGDGTVALRGCEVRRDTLPADLVRFQTTNTKVDPPSDLLTIPAAAITDNGVIGFIAPNRVRITGSLDWQNGGTALPVGAIGFTGGTLELAAGSSTTLSGTGTVTSTTLQNAGAFTALPGSTLRVTTGTVNEAGTMQFGDGTLLELRPSASDATDARLTGGTFTTTGTGVIRVFTGRNSLSAPSYATISGATVNGTVELAANLSRLRITGGGDLKGTVRGTAVASAGQGNFTSVDIQQNTTLSGVRFEDPSATQSAKTTLAVTGANTVTFGLTVECMNLSSITGDYFNISTGQIAATGACTIINEGLILCSGTGRSTNLAALDTFENRGTLEARGGATISADREFTQTAGRILLSGGSSFTMSNPAYRASTRLVTVSGGSVEGAGTFTGHLTMSGGTIAPGNGAGTLTLTGNLTLGAGSTLALDFASATSADQLAVNGPVTFTGPVQLALAPGFSGPTSAFIVLANDGADAIVTTPAARFAIGSDLLEEGETFTAAGRTWQITYAGGDGNDVSITLQGGSLTPLQTWRQLHFGTTGNAGDAADGADPDKDGIANLIEWGLGLVPTAASTLPVTTRLTASGLEFTYPRSIAAANAGTVFSVEASELLDAGWSSAGITQTTVSSDGLLEVVRAVIPAGAAGKFARLRILAPE